MKKILYFSLTLTIMFYSFTTQAQISDYEICDVNADGFGAFDLTTKIDEILDGADPSDYLITFHETYDDAESNVYPVTDPVFYNMIPYIQVMYVRVENLNDSTFVVDSFNLVVYLPQIGAPSTLYSYDGTFDLTVNTPLITQGNPYTISYFLTETDAYNNVAPILDPVNFISTTDTTIWVRAEDTNGCFSIINFEVSTIVYIPDANFKARLLQASSSSDIAKNATGQNIKIDTNNDGEIQVNEALNVYQLRVLNSNIGDLTGISAFINLTLLNCGQNNLTELDVSNNINLTYFWCHMNNLSDLDISNHIGLNHLYLSYNNISELDVSNNINLLVLLCDSNNLTELDISNNISLLELLCGSNNLTELDVSNNINLINLNFIDSNLTEIDVSNNVNLTHLYCRYNNLTELDVSNNVSLTHLYCEHNNLTELDLSNHPDLENLYAINNPELAYINIKNGGNLNPESIVWSAMWNNLPDNIYICADEDEAVAIFPHLNQSGSTGQTITTYCYVPGANYNTITGTITYDFDNNGCDENDNLTILTKVAINDGTNEEFSFANQNGEYKFFREEGEFTITPEVENPSFFNISPTTATITFTDNENNEEIINFCITPNGVHPDLEIVIAPIDPARPGFEATYQIVYRNKGNQVMSETISFSYNDDYLDFVSATQTPSTQSTGLLMWDYENLMPFESRSILVTMQVNTPTNPDFPVNIGDILTFTSIITPEEGDENVSDNIYIFNQTVVGAYDPNDITCIEGDVVEPEYIGEELHYVIRFENTGNYYAENVVVAMEIDTTKYDIDSVRLLDTSHNATSRIKDDILEIFFNQIMLDSGGHGNILLVMGSNNNLQEGDFVQSKADIYFDFNYPIITNDAVTVFDAMVSVLENEMSDVVSIYPNPTTGFVNIIATENIKSFELFDISGKLIRIGLVNDVETKIDFSSYQQGIYFLKINTNDGSLIRKIVRD